MEGAILDTQKHGIIVCLSKTHRPVHPEVYRPLTLLNASYKFLSGITANRLCPWINDLPHPSQDCGVQNSDILKAISVIRETIDKAELTNAPTSTLSLNFKVAFYNFAHSYLFAILVSYVFSNCFQQRL